jgi:tetratricopeptide (TPR) repeat protein
VSELPATNPEHNGAPASAGAADGLASSQTNAAPPPRRALALRWLLVVAAGFLAGLSLSLAFPPTSRAPAPPDPDERGSDPRHELLATFHKIDLAKAEALFKEGRYRQALAIFEPAIAGDKATGAVVLLRAALCHERLGEFDSAIRLYRRLVEHGAESAVTLASLAQARLYLARNHSAEARTVLTPLVLQARRYLADTVLLADAECLWSLALAHLALGPSTARTHPELAFASFAWDPERYLEALAQPPAQGADGGERLRVTTAPGSAEPTIVEARMTLQPVRQVLDRIAHAAGFTMSWTAEAINQANARKTTLWLADRPAIDVLRAVAVQADLVCIVQDGSITLTTAAAAADQSRAAFRRAAAERALHGVIARHPRHDWTAAAYLARAALDVEDDPGVALHWCERLILEAPRSPLTVNASFRRGLILEQRGELAEAEKAFFHVVDQAPGHALTPEALLHIGSMQLQAGEIGKAISVLRRGAALGAEPTVQARLALMLAAAHAVSDEPLAALAALARQRETLAGDAYRPVAAFLAAYARYRQAVLTQRLMRQDHELVAALLHFPNDTSLGVYGPILAARAFADAGMPEQAAQTLQAALPSTKGPLAHEAKHRLGQALARLGKNSEAARLFEELTQGQHRFTASAHLQLATLDLNANRPDACLERLHALMREPGTLNVAEVLTVMGRTYERKRDFVRAAQCFAGELPR